MKGTMFKRAHIFFIAPLLLTIPLSSLGNSATWILLKRDTDSLYYIDQRSIRKSEDRFLVKTLVKLSSPIFDSTSFLLVQKVNCKSNKNKIIDYLSFPSNERLYENRFRRSKRTPLPNYALSSEFTQKLCKHIIG